MTTNLDFFINADIKNILYSYKNDKQFKDLKTFIKKKK